MVASKQRLVYALQPKLVRTISVVWRLVGYHTACNVLPKLLTRIMRGKKELQTQTRTSLQTIQETPMQLEVSFAQFPL